MSLTRRIAHNTAIQIVGKVISTILGLIAIGMVTRHLDREGFGYYSTIQAYLQFFGVIVDFGLYIVLVKRVASSDAESDRVVSNIFTLRLLSAIIFLGLAPLLVVFLPYPQVVKIGVIVTSFSVLFVTLNQVLIGVFQRHLRMDRVALAEAGGRIVLLTATAFVVARTEGVVPVMAAVVAGSAATFLLTFVLVRRYVHLRLAFDAAVWRDVLRESWPIALSIVLNLVYFKADTLILSLTKPPEDVGIYGATYKVLEVLTTFPAMFAGLVTPVLAAAWAAQDRERFRRALQRSFDFLVLCALPLVVGTFFIAEPLMVLVAGDAFRASGDILRIIIIATGSIFIGNLFGNTVVAIGQQRRMIWVYLAVALVALVGYLVFIPPYSTIGAAWVTVVAEGSITIGAAVLVLRHSGTRLSASVSVRAAAATLCMGIVLALLPSVHVVLLLLIGAAVYGAALLLFRAIDRTTIREVLRLS